MHDNETSPTTPYYLEQMKMQAEAQNQAEAQQGSAFGLGGELHAAARTSLRESIGYRANKADSARYELDRLHRLIYLADKNPELFEMISLLRDLNFIS